MFAKADRRVVSWIAIVFATAILAWPPIPVAAQTKQQMDIIVRLRKLSLPSGRYMGTSTNEYYVREMSCYILGKLLGQSKSSAHLDPSLLDDDGSEQPSSLSENWAFNLDRLSNESEDRWVKEWNLDCAGQYGIPQRAAIKEASLDAFYDIREDGTVIYILGHVTEGFHSRLLSVLDANPAVDTVALGSGGGLVWEAMEAGKEIRKRGLSTRLWNDCYSACPLVFIAGKTREIWSPYPRLGFHQISFPGLGVTASDEMYKKEIYKKIAEYAEGMGVNSEALVNFMLQAQPSDFYYPDLETVCDAKLATWVQRQLLANC
ncbi:MAG: hypothetical protein AAAB35_22995 [Phyllobacterium sp.]|uniref:COG3904 family protein n=1 Tax=Phyllobacterium sp. TaxID=1871046 RepID=UPI0030F11855